MKVKVYEAQDGTVRVVHPNPRLQQDGESDDDFLERIAELTEQHDPTLRSARSTVVMNRDALPSREDRKRWRMANGRIVLSLEEVVPE